MRDARRPGAHAPKTPTTETAARATPAIAGVMLISKACVVKVFVPNLFNHRG